MRNSSFNSIQSEIHVQVEWNSVRMWMYNLASIIDLHTQVSSVFTLLELAVSSPINAKPSPDCLNEWNPSTDHLILALMAHRLRYPIAEPSCHNRHDSSDADTWVSATAERYTEYRNSSGWYDRCHTLIATDEGNAGDSLGRLWLDASTLALLVWNAFDDILEFLWIHGITRIARALQGW